VGVLVPAGTVSFQIGPQLCVKFYCHVFLVSGSIS